MLWYVHPVPPFPLLPLCSKSFNFAFEIYMLCIKYPITKALLWPAKEWGNEFRERGPAHSNAKVCHCNTARKITPVRIWKVISDMPLLSDTCGSFLCMQNTFICFVSEYFFICWLGRAYVKSIFKSNFSTSLAENVTCRSWTWNVIVDKELIWRNNVYYKVLSKCSRNLYRIESIFFKLLVHISITWTSIFNHIGWVVCL